MDQIMGLIESQDMMGFITGECAVPNQYITVPVAEGAARTKEVDNPQHLAWRRYDRLLRGWITGTLSEEILGLVVGLDTSHDVWTVLLNHFVRGSQGKEFFLLQQLQLLRKGFKPGSWKIWKQRCRGCSNSNRDGIII